MRKISIIHPSRGRAALAANVSSKWLNRAYDRGNIEYIVSIDNEPSEIDSYVSIFRHSEPRIDRLHITTNRSAIDAINNAARVASGDIFIVVSDDFDCPLHWDKMLLDAIGDRGDFVAKTNDGCQPWIITLPIMDRAYYNRFGYVYYSAYQHLFCDTEMTHVGDMLGRTIPLNITFPHRHYTQEGGIQKDAISNKNDATWAQGEALYLARLANNFGIANPKQFQLPKHHYDWLRTKGVIA